MIKALYKIVEAIKNLSNQIIPICGCMACGSETVLPAGGSGSYVTFINEIEDTHNSFDGTLFVVPSGQSGLYEISSVISAYSNDGVRFIVWANVNGSNRLLLGRGVSGAATICGFGGSAKTFLNEGDLVRISAQLYNTVDTTLTAGDMYNYFSIYRVR